MLFSLFVLYCLYRMALDPTLEMTGHSAPPAPADPGFAWKLMRTYEALAVVVTSGQVISWVLVRYYILKVFATVFTLLESYIN